VAVEEFGDWADCIPSGPTQPQLDFLADLGLELGVDLLAEASDIVGWQVTDLRSLSITEASDLLDHLKAQRRF